MICKMLCFGHVAACFLSKRFYILDTCIIFHEIIFFKELLAFIAFYFLQSALFHSWRFISFIALYFSFHGAFILFRALLFFLYSAFQFLHSAFLILHSAFLKFSVWVSTCIFSNCESAALFHFPSKLSCSYYFNS